VFIASLKLTFLMQKGAATKDLANFPETKGLGLYRLCSEKKEVLT